MAGNISKERSNAINEEIKDTIEIRAKEILAGKADMESVESLRVVLGEKSDKTYVDNEIKTVNDRIDTVNGEIESLYEDKADKSDVEDKVSIINKRIGSISNTLNTINGDIETLNDDKADKSDVDTALSGKVDKVSGKGLSSNDFTDDNKSAVDMLDALTEGLLYVPTDLQIGRTFITDDIMIPNASTDAIYFVSEQKSLKDYLDEKSDNPSTFYYQGGTAGLYIDLHLFNNYMFFPNNKESTLATLGIYIPESIYSDSYICNITFRSGEAPTSVIYPDNSHVINWVGTDCSNDSGHSKFQPSPNKTYDIIIYFNGLSFVGLVNGYTPASVNDDANAD